MPQVREEKLTRGTEKRSKEGEGWEIVILFSHLYIVFLSVSPFLLFIVFRFR
jgi:hypothetical protein